MRRLICVLLLTVCAPAVRGQMLVPYTDGERWGYADMTGKVVLPVQWTSATFFDADRAIVGISSGDKGEAHFALINRRGKYIIPPSRRWTGQWEGFGSTALNTSDSAGRWGLVDTTNRLLIRHEFETTRVMVDSTHRTRFAILSKAGLWGAMNATGEMVVQAKWKALMPLDGDGGPVAFQASSDSGNALLDSTGRMLTPASYHEFQWARSSAFQGFAASRSVRVRGAEKQLWGFIEYPTGRVLLEPRFAYVRLTPHGHFIVGNDAGEVAVFDSAGVARLPFSCFGYYASSDTIYQIHYLEWRHDSTISEVRHFDGRTLSPLSDWHRQAKIGLTRSFYNEGFCGTGRAMAAQMEHAEAMRPTILVNGRPVKQVTLDGVTWHTQKFANWPAHLYAMYGWPAQGAHTSAAAVLDSCLGLQFSPLRNQGSIVHYNPEAGLVVVQTHDGGNRTLWRVIDTTGRVLLTQTREILQTLVANGRFYLLQPVPQDWHSASFDESGEPPTRLCDTAGQLIPELASYRILAPVSAWGDGVTTNSAILHVVDSARQQGFVDVSGKVVWPGVSFQMARVEPLGNGRFFLSNVYRTDGLLTDTSGRDLAPSLRITSVNRVRTYPAVGRGRPSREVPGLWMASYHHRSGPKRRGVFYFGARGTIFTNGFEKRTEPNKNVTD